MKVAWGEWGSFLPLPKICRILENTLEAQTQDQELPEARGRDSVENAEYERQALFFWGLPPQSKGNVLAKPKKSTGIFLSPGAYVTTGGEARDFSKSQSLYEESTELFQVPGEGIYEDSTSPRFASLFYSPEPHISSYFLHIS